MSGHGILQLARYRFVEDFDDPDNGWLEVSRIEVLTSGAEISGDSRYDPRTDMVYLEYKRDMWSFLQATRQTWLDDHTVCSSAPQRMPAYDAAAALDTSYKF